MRLLEKLFPQIPEVAATDADFSTIRSEDVETAKMPDLEELVRNLPERILVDDPRITQLVMELSSVDSEPAVTPVPLQAVNKMMQARVTRRHTIDVYRGEWPDVEAIPDSDIPLPVDLFVAAPLITDWREGRGSELKDDQESSEIIRQYAAMSPKSQPAIRNVDIVVSRDGGVFLALQGDGAHRLCAAKMRGDVDILCRRVTIVELD